MTRSTTVGVVARPEAIAAFPVQRTCDRMQLSEFGNQKSEERAVRADPLDPSTRCRCASANPWISRTLRGQHGRTHYSYRYSTLHYTLL